MKTLAAKSVDDQQLAQLDRVRDCLPANSQLADTLDYLAEALRSGLGVTVVTDETRVTPNQAAKVLGMSRSHLYKLLDQGLIKSVSVGRDRRIALSDLREFTESMDRDNAELAERFAHKDRDRTALIERLAK
ncbi:helix-turn-helix domain-containing protein [Williamsia sp. D3]|uniref:helix-turn-helix domain-containing protein n=1 Tax=Williamsia sp. D3 TaxID=1313067 RepID=UPI0003D36642|nr:helix-turn-helix domain-containing protein [Williamsia sp. D3]ETD34423.1 excisionase [Williamsia sp. D3]